MLIHLMTTETCEENGQFISETDGLIGLIRNIIHFIRTAVLVKKGSDSDIFFVDSYTKDKKLNMDLQLGRDERETFKWISGNISWDDSYPNHNLGLSKIV